MRPSLALADRGLRSLGLGCFRVLSASLAITDCVPNQCPVVGVRRAGHLPSCGACDYTSNVEKTEAPAIPFAYTGEPILSLRPAHCYTPGVISMEEQAKRSKTTNTTGCRSTMRRSSISTPPPGARRPGRYKAFRGIEVGQVFKLGTKYSTTINCTYLDGEGHEHTMLMGCYGIGITRTIAAVIEQNYDDDGIIWPWPVAPFHVQIVCLDLGAPEILSVATVLERELEAAGIEVLLDDRENLSPGVRFKDADLLGFPLRVVVRTRGLKHGTVELRDRCSFK